jgi:glycosyltransferase involved in cell wall biosynthesis
LVSFEPGSADQAIETLTESLRSSLDVLVICFSFAWGGLEQVAYNDALDLEAAGLKVKFLCLEGSPIADQLTRHPKIRRIALDYTPRDFFDLKLRTEVLKWIHEGVNVIHTHQTSYLASLVPWLWNHPKVTLLATRHIMNGHSKRGLFHRVIYSRVDALIVMSSTLKRNVLETHALGNTRIKVINLGLDFDRFDPKRTNAAVQRGIWGADEDTVVIGLVGRIDPAKGQATFIKAAAGLMKNLRPGEKLKFVVVGEETLKSGNAHLDDLKEMVRQFRLEDTVFFAGFQENIPEIMRAFNIFVMPSRQEAFGLVAIEAMAMECPIVISSGGSASEIVGDNEFGLTIKPEDAYDLQRQIRHLLDQPLERIKMGQRAREHVKKNYDKKVRLLKTLKLYNWGLKRRLRTAL